MRKRNSKILSLILGLILIFQQSGFAQLATELNIARHLTGFHNPSVIDKFRPIHLRYLQYDSINNDFRLFLDKGDQLKQPNETNKLNEQAKELLKYFYIGLALPNSKFWVNLRPDAEDNIIDDYLTKTDIGRIMLETDLQLKKDTAAMTSPQTPEGRQYWDKLYKKAAELYGYDNVTISTLTRPWIVPGEIIIRENKNSAYIYKATLKVMLEQDYLVNTTNATSVTYATYSFKDPRAKALNEYSSQLIRELIIPKLTREVNSSKRYAALRQVYYSLILAQWFKARLKELSPQETVIKLIDSQDLTNLISQEAWSKTTYFRAYQKSFKDGEYNIQEPVYTPTGQVIRSYFSGGEMLVNLGPLAQLGGILSAASPMIAIVAQGKPAFNDNLVEIKYSYSSLVDEGESIQRPQGRSSKGQASSPVETKLYYRPSVLARETREVISQITPDIQNSLKLDFSNPAAAVIIKQWIWGDLRLGKTKRMMLQGIRDYVTDINKTKETSRPNISSETAILESVEEVLNRTFGGNFIGRTRIKTKFRKGTLNEHFYEPLSDEIFLDERNLSYPWAVLEEGLHSISGGFPSYALTEGYTNYLVRMLVDQRVFTQKYFELLHYPLMQRIVSQLITTIGEEAIALSYFTGDEKYTIHALGNHGELVFSLLCALDDFWIPAFGMFEIDPEEFTRLILENRNSEINLKLIGEIMSLRYNYWERQEFSEHNKTRVLSEIDRLKSLFEKEPLVMSKINWSSFEREFRRIVANSNNRYLVNLARKLLPLSSETPSGDFTDGGNDIDDPSGLSSSPADVKKSGGIDSSALFTIDSPQTKRIGGIDFRTLPIVTQAMSNLKLSTSSSLSLDKLQNINLNQELGDIQKMLKFGITPSTDRIKEYVASSCLKGDLDIQKIVSCIANILRLEEEHCIQTDSVLRDILVVLESSGSMENLRAIFIGADS